MHQPHWRDPYSSAKRGLALLLALLIAIIWGLALFPRPSDAASPEPFWAPAGTVIGVLYISDGTNITTEYGGILFPPDSAVGTLLRPDGSGGYYPAGEVTITYWVEPDTQ